MTRTDTWPMFAAVTWLLAATPTVTADDPPLTSRNDRFSYVMGVDIARNSKRQGIEIDPKLILRGIEDALANQRLLLSEKEVRQIQSDLLGEVRRRQAHNQRELGELNKAAGDSFLATNRTKPGVISLPSGLQYRILTAGNGPKPQDHDMVQCHLRGTLIDGTEFQSTDPGQPATLRVKAGPSLIPGLAEALKLMPVGSKWQLVVPPRLAYGFQGAGREIGPNATLLYEIELVRIQP